MEEKPCRDWDKGLVQVYTGNGKGKTTAALGLAFRAMGCGMRTYMGQFMKGMYYSELESAARVAPAIVIEQYGSDKFICKGEVDPEEVERAQKGLERIRWALGSGGFDVVVMDEICTALHFEIVEVGDVLGIIAAKPEAVELILTGRYAPPQIIAAADLVTEMNPVKHYFDTGVQARRGIEN